MNRSIEESTLGPVMSDVMRLLRQDFAVRAAGSRLTPALWRLLFAVSRTEGARQTDLADRLEITAVTVGRMLERLERDGLVRREADAADRRASRVHLGERAGPLMEELRAVAVATDARATAGLTVAERDALFSALKRVRANLQDPSLAAPALRRAGGFDGR
jgi:DNA-binding MarR family transcriptional regulator